MTEQGSAADRRQRVDRREGSPSAPAAQRRGQRKKGLSPLAIALRSVGAIVVLLGVIIYAVGYTRPIFTGRGKLAEELARRTGPLVPMDSSNVDKIMASQKFQEEKRNFYEDVMRLKQVDSARADSIAQFAVREAYVRGISPAIIFGVMLTENSRFISKAQSNVGAVGLMQVYPKVWLNKQMTALFGSDLVSDSTNVKYGVFILNHYFNPKDRKGQPRTRDWQTALLRYNGCVKGTNTPRCHTYPSKVQSFVENQAKSICDGRAFYDCIAKPFIDGLIHAGKPVAPDKPRPPADSVAADLAPGATTVPTSTTAPVAPVAPLAPVVMSPMTASPSAAAKAATSRATTRKSTVKKSSARRTSRSKAAAKKKTPVKKKTTTRRER